MIEMSLLEIDAVDVGVVGDDAEPDDDNFVGCARSVMTLQTDLP